MMIDKKRVFGDVHTEVEMWDFSKANKSLKNRLETVITLSKGQNTETLEEEDILSSKTLKEKGVDLEALRAIPVLLSMLNKEHRKLLHDIRGSMSLREGDFVTGEWFLTNYKAILQDWEDLSSDKEAFTTDIRLFFNDDIECGMIEHYMQTFKMRIPAFLKNDPAFLPRHYYVRKRNKPTFYISKVIREKDEEFCSEIKKTQLIATEQYEILKDSGLGEADASSILPRTIIEDVWVIFSVNDMCHFQRRLREKNTFEAREIIEAVRFLVSKNKLDSEPYIDSCTTRVREL